MDARYSQPSFSEHEAKPITAGWHVSRRSMLKLGALGLAASTLGILEAEAWLPQRVAHAAPSSLPQIQFDISNYIAPAQTIDGVLFRFGPVHTLFITARLKRTPTKSDQHIFSEALNAIEDAYEFSPAGVFSFISYGLPYFHRLPVGLVVDNMPRLLADPVRFALEEAVPGPTDVSPRNPRITKQTFNVPVAIESNEVLFTFRSDSLDNLRSIAAWLQGSNHLNGKLVPSLALEDMFVFTSSRLMFLQMGMPRKIADSNALPYAGSINPHSPMWMGFADQQVAGAGPATITTFQGNASARFTNTKAGDYFYDGSIQHFSHVILDLSQFYASSEPYTERCQYMFRSNPIPSTGHKNQYKDGGGPVFFANRFQGAHDALANAEAINTYQHEHRMGHLAALQRSSRAADSTPIHIRMDGPGFDALDVPGGYQQPKLQFTIFVPSADFFATMRKNQAALDLVDQYGVQTDDNGLERFLTATRRQNFLVPPRAHRAFPLLELSDV
ncbi:MAG TPA: hypothetical protein VKR83_20510 [Ktedonobacteraceae bacterium]|nr:hypothetical protein [Ktedonobacteraceae bacterium]